MGNPVLPVRDNGYGDTPVPDGALLRPGDELNIHDENDGSQTPAKVVAVVPVGVAIETAIADQGGEPRPLMVTPETHTEILYVLDWKGRRVNVAHTTIARGLDQAQAAGLNEATP